MVDGCAARLCARPLRGRRQLQQALGGIKVSSPCQALTLAPLTRQTEGIMQGACLAAATACDMPLPCPPIGFYQQACETVETALKPF